MNQTFAGKVALITGASRGIGSALAEQFAANGAKVAVNYSRSEQHAQEVVERIRQTGGEAAAIQADVTRITDIERLFQEVLRLYGAIDILVNNAGILITKPILEFTEEDFDALFNIHVKGTFFACQQAARHMNANGRIINFSTSVNGGMFPQYSAYAGAKGAVEQITRQLAKEFGHKGITVNAVAPGPVNTELFTVGKTEEQIAGLARLNAFNRLGEPDDVAAAVLFLAGAGAQWVNGQTLRVNGGFV